MQKWSLEPLTVDPEVQGGFVPVTEWSTPAEPSNTSFRPEAGFADPASLLAALSREERAQVMELVDQDIRTEYEARAQQAQAEQIQAEAQRQATLTEALDQWRDQFSVALRQEIDDALSTLARRTVDIAVLMAEKLVRREVVADTGVLVRALETVLFKTEAGSSMQVTAHPDDATWLRDNPELCSRLRITEVKDDRRLARGGALVSTDSGEWDATIERQLAVLAETFEEAFLLPAEADPVLNAAPDDPTPEVDDA